MYDLNKNIIIKEKVIKISMKSNMANFISRFKSYRKSVDIKKKAICERIIDVPKRKCEREMERICLSSFSILL